uniref:glycosyltransferase family 4 protein n=1 Tax=uncultured Sphingomonas sp. TaxID=158754 RepID=UPI0025F87076|nr:glycosyltransferase family 4 protein [uncultured Sphingomonas sp.]
MSRRLRLFLTTDAVGGVWTYSLELAAALAVSHDVAVILATLGPSPRSEQRERAAAIPGLQLVDTGLPLDWTADSRTELRDAAAALAALAGRAEADVVQLHAPALACADYPAPVVSVMHSCVATWWTAVRGTDLPLDLAWRTELAREGMAGSDLLVAPSRAFARAVQHSYRLTQPPVAVHNGRSPLPRDPVQQANHAFTAGRLWDDGKNVAAFDRAAALAGTPFRAAGPARGPNGAGIELRHAQAAGLLPEDRLAAELGARPIFVSTALYEPFGLSVLEAAQAGCALVLSDIPTFRELWEDAAAFVEPTDEQAIAETVDRLAAHPDEREQLGAAARERAGRFTPDTMAGAMMTRYRGLLGRQRKAAA